MRLSGDVPRRVRWQALLGLGLLLTLTGCASWTHPAKPASALADDSAACKAEAAQAALSSGQFDLDQDNAFSACMRAKGWTLQERR